jgi:hypothetical protein
MIGGFPLWAWGEKLMQTGQDYGILLRAENEESDAVKHQSILACLPAVFISPPQCYIN